MADPLSFLQNSALKTPVFPETSHYTRIGTKTYETVSGESIVHLRRRFVPQPERFELLQQHTVTEGERLDNITSQYYNDPEQYWKICDANGVIRPNELVDAIGKKIRITLPEGIPGNTNG